MKKILYSIAVLFVLLMIVSCSGKKVEIRVAKIDSLSNVLDDVHNELKEIKYDTIKNRFQIFKRTNDSVSKYFKEIRTDESWKYICAYQEIKEPLEEMAIKYAGFNAKIDSSVKQLENLKHDVKAKVLSDKEFETFYMNERESVDAVYESISECIESVNMEMKNFDTVHPYLVKLLNNHKSGKKTTK